MTVREDERVNRIVATLAVWPDTRIRRDLFARMVSNKKDVVPESELGRLWPVIETRLLAVNHLFLIRPLPWLQYGLAAATEESMVLVQKKKRNGVMSTMMHRDGVEGGALRYIRDHSLNPRWAVTAAMALSADDAWLKAGQRTDPFDVAVDMAVEEFRKLPWLQWDGHHLYKVEVGPNGLPLSNGHHK